MLRLLVGATLLALTFAGGFAVAAHKTVTLTVDGTQMTVATMKSRVIDVVKENGFDVGERRSRSTVRTAGRCGPPRRRSKRRWRSCR